MDGDGPPSVNGIDANPISAILRHGNTTTNKSLALLPRNSAVTTRWPVP